MAKKPPPSRPGRSAENSPGTDRPVSPSPRARRSGHDARAAAAPQENLVLPPQTGATADPDTGPGKATGKVPRKHPGDATNADTRHRPGKGTHNGAGDRPGNQAAPTPSSRKPRAATDGGERGYPRPQLVRDSRVAGMPDDTPTWGFLNGLWDFAFGGPAGASPATAPSSTDVAGHDHTGHDHTGRESAGGPGRAAVLFDRTIVVPFAPETPASRVHEQGYFSTVWYRRRWDVPELRVGERLLLHFGAVDYLASVYVDGVLAVRHEGGYSPFSADITEHVAGKTTVELLVHAEDDPHDMAKPRGKQDWLEKPHAIWYPRTTGIWQSVWWEVVPETYLCRVRWHGDAVSFRVRADLQVAGPSQRCRAEITLSIRGKMLARGSAEVTGGQASVDLALADPGIMDARHHLMWAPWHPNLLDAEVLLHRDGEVIDRAGSYTALREVRLENGRFWLSGGPVRLDLVLDQGYWPESGLTAPDDDALRRDVELTKAMGFNGVRKHQKIEDPRYLYWADRLGLMVWSEFPGCYAFTEQAVERTTKQWLEAVARDVSHPCIVAWVPFNESWGVPNLPTSPAQRALLDGIYHLTKALDPTRPVIGNDGWEMPHTDILAVHDYEADPVRLLARYSRPREHFVLNETPGHKVLVLAGYDFAAQPVMLTEFGGIAFSKDYEGTWGYSRARTADDLAGRYGRLLEAVRAVPIFAGFCYTQLTDTYQEANGLLYMDRTPKFDLKLMSIATRGAWNEEERALLQAAIAVPAARA